MPSTPANATPGRHYTPRAYVERLVLPTVIEAAARPMGQRPAAALVLAHEAAALQGKAAEGQAGRSAR